MPLLKDGWYVAGDDRGYEAEATYYLRFQITSAVFSLNKLFEESIEWTGFNSKPEYYHYYTDHLLYAMGQIHNRFYPNHNENDLNHARRKANMNNYRFSKEEFPILAEKNPRNTIEHIEEYNKTIIEQFNGVGGFNVILPDMPLEIKQGIEKRKDLHPYILNLIEKRLFIMRNGNEINIDLEKLMDELQRLHANVQNFQSFLTF